MSDGVDSETLRGLKDFVAPNDVLQKAQKRGSVEKYPPAVTGNNSLTKMPPANAPLERSVPRGKLITPGFVEPSALKR